jgi:hypothetical protein
MWFIINITTILCGLRHGKMPKNRVKRCLSPFLFFQKRQNREGVSKSFRKGVLVAFVVLFVGISILYAQSNATLRGGAYRARFMSGEEGIVISNHTGTTKNVG